MTMRSGARRSHSGGGVDGRLDWWAPAVSVKSLDVFSLRDAVVGEYRKFATSFTTIHAEDIRLQVDAIYSDNRYWPEPLIQINPSYRLTTTVGGLPASGVLHPTCAEMFRTSPSADLPQGEPARVVQAPRTGDRPCVAGGRLRRHDRHRLGQVVVLLHSHRRHCAPRAAGRWSEANAGNCHLPDGCAREQPNGGAQARRR